MREDTSFGSCTPECRAWCRCPEGSVFFNYTECVPEEEYPVQCQDENPQAMSCTNSGGSWTSCVDTCTYCLSDSGERTMDGNDCSEVCEYGCNCPEGQSFTEEGCKPDAEVLQSCNEIGGDEGNAGGEESDSCHQMSDRASLWLLLLLLLVVITRQDTHRECV